jgi:hypothetical protein
MSRKVQASGCFFGMPEKINAWLSCYTIPSLTITLALDSSLS